MSEHWTRVPDGTPNAIVGYDERGEQCLWALTPDVESEARGVVEDTLTERGKNYGDFTENADYAQRIKLVFRSSPQWEHTESYIRESLDLIASKIARLLSGDPYHVDGWHDIQGYAKLVEQRIKQRSKR